MRGPIHPWIDEVEARIYRIRFPARGSDDEVEHFVSAREAWAERCDHRHAWIVDLTRVREATARQRQRFARHLEEYEPCDLAWNAGSAIVLESRWIRGVMTAVFWLKRPQFPNATFATEEAAQAWCRHRLHDPPAAR